MSDRHAVDVPPHVIVPNRYTGRWVIVTGVRDIAPESMRSVSGKLIEVVGGGADGIIFGGARGTDTLALIIAHTARSTPIPQLVVIVPGTLSDQPVETRTTTRSCADEIIEMRQDMSKKMSYFERNRRMITEGRLRDAAENPVCIGFPANGVSTGGTRACMRDAMRAGVEVEEVPVNGIQNGVD